MSDSFFTAKRDSDLAAGSANFAARISASPTTYGLTAAQATSYAAVNTAFQTALATALAPSTRTRGAVAAKNVAANNVRRQAAILANFVDGTTTVTEQQRIDLGLSVRKTPTHPGNPGTANKLKVGLTALGNLDLSWKCTNPTGGTMYQIFRTVGTGTPVYLGGTGEKKFTDTTLPAGAANITYAIQAVRSSGVGAWADFNVKIGGGGTSPLVTAVAHDDAVKIAA